MRWRLLRSLGIKVSIKYQVSGIKYQVSSIKYQGWYYNTTKINKDFGFKFIYYIINELAFSF